MKLLLFIVTRLISLRKDKKMKPGVIVAFIAVSLSILSSQLYAENITDKLSYDGQIRLRSELDWKSFSPEREAQSYHYLRTRFGLRLKASKKASVFIQFQDSRQLGYPSSGGLDLYIEDKIHLHQAYFTVENLLIDNLNFKGGRFELNYGNQRIFGSVGWHNRGRSWDGFLIYCENSRYKFDFFTLIKDLGYSHSIDDDFNIYGAYFSEKTIGLDLFTFFEHNRSNIPFIKGYSIQELLKRFNVGGYYSSKYKYIDFTIQGNYQLGEKPRGHLPDSLVLDLSALMLAAEVGYTFKTENPLRLAAGIDYTSGDDGSDATKFKAYQNDYYTGHAFRGYMDYFIGSPDHGLVDLMFRSSLKYQKDWMFKGDFHYFQSAEYYQSESDYTIKTKDIGMEIDLTVVNKSVEGATFTGGVSAFFADKHYSHYGDDSDPGLWAYFMTTINF